MSHTPLEPVPTFVNLPEAVLEVIVNKFICSPNIPLPFHQSCRSRFGMPRRYRQSCRWRLRISRHAHSYPVVATVIVAMAGRGQRQAGGLVGGRSNSAKPHQTFSQHQRRRQISRWLAWSSAVDRNWKQPFSPLVGTADGVHIDCQASVCHQTWIADREMKSGRRRRKRKWCAGWNIQSQG